MLTINTPEVAGTYNYGIAFGILDYPDIDLSDMIVLEVIAEQRNEYPSFIEPPFGTYEIQRGTTLDVFLELEDLEKDEVSIEVDLSSTASFGTVVTSGGTGYGSLTF